MRREVLRILGTLGIALAVLLAGTGLARAQWKTLSTPFSPDTCVLLTDGSAMCHEYSSPNWHRLTPDPFGSYASGTWDSPPIPPMPNGVDTSGSCNAPTGCTYAPLYFASAVLPDGRVVVIGGEDNPGTSGNMVETNIGFMYDPVANKWSSQLTEQFGTGNVGDAISVVLQDGTMVLGSINSGGMESFDPSTLTFTLLNDTNKFDSSSEEGWTILPGVLGAAAPLNGMVLDVDSSASNAFEIYDPTGNAWGSSGTTAGLTLADDGPACPKSFELGPTVALPNGTIIQFSGGESGKNAIYDISTGIWTENTSLDFPLDTSTGWQLSVEDGPASLLPNGHALVMASPGCNSTNKTSFNRPSHIFEWDGTTLNDVTLSGATFANASKYDSYQGRMLLLPSGDVLVMGNNQAGTQTVELYTATGGPQDAWRPVITDAPVNVGQGETYSISGNQFNGFAQGATYGDDAQMATNYPLVRITNQGTGHVFYARTHDHNRMGVEAVGSTEVETTNFDAPATLELGASTMVVVTNGIPSDPFNINVGVGSALTYTGPTSDDFNDSVQVQALLTQMGTPITSGEPVTFKLGSGAGTETCSATTNGSGVASCPITPNQPAGTYTLTVTFAGDATYGASSVSTTFSIKLEDTSLAYTGATTSDYDDPAIVKAQLTDPTGGAPISGKTVTFVLGSGVGAPTCLATTDGSGNASCTLTPNEPAGSYPLVAAFSGDAFYLPASATTTFTVTKEEDTLTFTPGSATVIANGHSASLSATLKEDGVAPISGRSVTITLGTGVTAQSCIATTDVIGTAACAILVNQPLGPNTVAANFAGDGFYLPSSASEPVILFAFLSQGSMIIGNLDAAPGVAVNFWGAQWAKSNSLSGGPAPDSFKGFASTAPQSCGGGWTSSPGNSSGPPATVPSYMGVIASSSVLQLGSSLAGDVPIIVVVKTNAGYGPSPGHAGTGTVIAIFCH